MFAELTDEGRRDDGNDLVALHNGLDHLKNLALVHDRTKGAGYQTLTAGNAFVLIDDSPAILTHTDGIRAILSEAPTEAEAREMVEAVGLSMKELYDTYGEAHIEEALRWAKDLKDRYSVLWVHGLYYR
jgi:hypothetical protein